MDTTMQRLLGQIESFHLLDRYLAGVADALNSFDRSGGAAAWSGDLDGWAGDVMFHVECHLRRMPKPPYGDREQVRRLGYQVLTDIYGHSGVMVAAELVRSGKEGGRLAVEKAIAEHVAKKLARHDLRAMIEGMWGSLSSRDKLAAGVEFLELRGEWLPDELKSKGGVRVLADLPAALEKYGELVHSMRKVVRK